MLETVFVVLGGIFTAMIIVGVSQKNRNTILTGLFCYSFLPILGETLGWLIDKEIFHLLFISLFLCQLIITSIRFQDIDDTHIMFSKFAVRMLGVIFIINAISALIILAFSNTINTIYGMYHVLICVVLIPVILKRFLQAIKKN